MTEKKKKFHCGFASIVGRPNTGKSTLLNAIMEEKIAIVSKIPQTTRNQIRGIYTGEEGQIIFVDTPGLVRGKDKMDQFMKQVSLKTADEGDCVIHLVDSNKVLGEEENMIIEQLVNIKRPLILGLNKIDLKGKCAPEYISAYQEKLGKAFNNEKKFTILPLSSKTGANVDTLIDILLKLLPEGPALYPEDMICDVPQKMVVADIIREKFLEILRDELPYSIAVQVDEIKGRRNKLTYVGATVLVAETTHKEMVIGKRGQVLKKVGTSAREELEKLLDRRVFIDIRVKVRKKWRDDVSLLKELGYGT